MLRICFTAILLVCGSLSAGMEQSLRAEVISLREPVNDSRTFHVTVQVKAQGKLKTPVKEDAAAELPLDMQARMVYLERRLPAAGRDDRAFRSLRRYEQATSRIIVKEQTTQLQLSSHVKDVVAEGQRSNLWLYSEQTPLQRRDIDLLNLPGDPLAMLATLPLVDVETEESWPIAEWAGQMLAGVEAATSSKLTGKLISLQPDTATLQIQGEVAGATTGAATKVQVEGTAVFDRKHNYLRSLKLTQKEERGISTVSPGMDVTATIEWERKPVTAPPAGTAPTTAISDEAVQGIPLDMPPLAQLLLFHSRHWNFSLMHDRHWHLFQEIPEVTVLRLVESGSLISQCNIARIPKMRPGTHVAPEKFESDIKTSLGTQFSQIVESAEVPSENGNFIYRVVAAGGANDLQMIWIYYLCAHPDGRQVSFVFAVEQSNVEALNGRDLTLVESLTFAPEKP